MTDIRVIMWDFAGVLLHTVKGTFNSLMAERLDVPLSDVEKVMNSRMNERWDIDDVDDITFYSYLLKSLHQPLEKISILQRFVVKDFFVDKVILEKIKALRENYINVLLTNFPRHFHDFTKTDWIIDGAFDHIIASCDVKLIKPDPAIYHLALNRAGCEPHQAVFLDDREENVRAAEALGMQGIVFDDKVRSMQKLEEILSA